MSAFAMLRTLRPWVRPVGVCLLLQAAIAAAGVLFSGVLLNRSSVPDPPCCDSPLVL